MGLSNRGVCGLVTENIALFKIKLLFVDFCQYRVDTWNPAFLPNTCPLCFFCKSVSFNSFLKTSVWNTKGYTVIPYTVSFNLKVNCELLESCSLLSDVLQHNIHNCSHFKVSEIGSVLPLVYSIM